MSARADRCGGSGATLIPTATIYSIFAGRALETQ